MVYEQIDLYEYFRLPRGKNTGGYLSVYAHGREGDLPARVRPAMLVIPGGGYAVVSGREGSPVAVRFFSKGYSAFVLSYTVKAAYPAPLIEGGMAMAYIRENAEKYDVDPAHVGAVGFSAGGHLAGMLATMFGDGHLKEALKDRPIRPDAVILSYPVVTTGIKTHGGSAETISGGDETLKARLSIEKRVTGESSPAFIWHTYEDDCVPVENALLLASAYRNANVPCELHVFEHGWHGLSLVSREENGVLDAAIARNAVWSELAFGWLEARGFAVRDR